MKAKIIFQKNKVDDVIYHFNFNMHEKKIHQKYISILLFIKYKNQHIWF